MLLLIVISIFTSYNIVIYVNVLKKSGYVRKNKHIRKKGTFLYLIDKFKSSINYFKKM